MKRLLFIIQLFVALGAIAGGIALVTNGLGMSLEVLSNSPFSSFLIPGLALTFLVGGTAAYAAIRLFERGSESLIYSGIAGLALNIWMFIEIMFVSDRSWLQWLMYALSVAMLTLTYLIRERNEYE